MSPTTCPTGAQVISWNAVGPQGPTGPQGPAGLSSAQYTSANAWVQSVATSGTTLSIPSGEQLTITGALFPEGMSDYGVQATLNGTTATYEVTASTAGAGSSTDSKRPSMRTSGSIESCDDTTDMNLVGYLTPVPPS